MRVALLIPYLAITMLTCRIHGATDPSPQPTPTPRILPVTPTAPGKPGFTRLPPTTTRIAFTNLVAESRSLTNHILLNGSGVAAGDIDGDGLCDLYFCAIDGPNALYRNLGNWKFIEIAAAAGVDCPSLDATGAVFADIDGDRDLDLLVSAIRGGVSCFLNDGNGRFTNVTRDSGLTSTSGSMSLALADIDGDGDLDLYVANYRNETLRDGFRMQIRVGVVNGRRVVTRVNNRPLQGPELEGWVTLDDQGNISENGQADALYRNEGGGRFVHLPFNRGTFLDEHGRPLPAPLYDWTLTAMFRDLNGDRAPDLYVCSDLASPDRIWLNRGHGVFQAAPPTALRKTSWFSMGVDCADLDRDGFDDLFVTDMVSREHRLRQVQVSDHQPVFARVGVFDDRPQAPRNTLFWNCGDGGYLEAAYFAGLEASDWSWSPVFLDVDLDGYEDVLITTGFERDVQDVDIANQLEAIRQNRQLSDLEALKMRARFPRLAQPNLAFRNRGNRTFEEVGKAWGFDAVGVSQGLALADLDNDGDLDVAVNNMNEAAGIYRNDSPAPRVAVRLLGSGTNTRGVGARIRVSNGLPFARTQEIQAGGRYLSSDEPLRVFAAGNPTQPLHVEVAWRDGSTTTLSNVPANSIVEIPQANPPPERSLAPPPTHPAVPLFENRDAALASHRHHDREFDDFARQRLLPRKLSQLGPAIAWADLDRDGWDDLLVGTGAGGTPAAFRNDTRGGFIPWTNTFTTTPTERDLTGLLAIANHTNGVTLLLAESNYEDPAHRPSLIHTLAWPLAKPRLLTNHPAATGPLALGDLDGDGQLELFVGSRAIGGRFPQPPSSHLYRQRDGFWQEDTTLRPLFQNIGMVSAALFSDLEGDGFPELVLACDWGALRLFRNTRGQLAPWNPPLSHPTPNPTPNPLAPEPRPPALPASLLEHLTGWWNGVTAGDFDGDGNLDLLASNWGRNTKYENHRAQPLRLVSGDFADSGEIIPIEVYWEPALGKVVPWMHLGRFLDAIPSLAGRYRTFREFGLAGISEILGAQMATAHELQATWLDSTLFLNRTNSFEVRPLPTLAQWSPAFAIAIADFDGDGHEDAFLSQNFFATEPETGRYDGGRGLCLRGDGQGGWTPLTSAQSGVVIHGEQRAAAVADYDADGRPDLVVSQNGAATRLFRNTGARPGLRVRLAGPPTNPSGIGAVLRLEFGTRAGPAREIHAGSGYWSQDSPVTVLATPEPPTRILVRWPGGKLTSMAVPQASTELIVPFPSPP